MPYGMQWGYGYGGGILMLLFWIFVIAGIIWLVLALTRPGGRLTMRGDDSASARRILDERLARGEIDVEEYRARRVALDERVK